MSNRDFADATDLLLLGVLDGTVGADHLTLEQTMVLQEELMDHLAVKLSGHTEFVNKSTYKH